MVRERNELVPDPLLTMLYFERGIEEAERLAQRLDTSLYRDGEFVFLEVTDPTGQKRLARIDCGGYPLQRLDVEFIDPVTPPDKRVLVEASKDRRHWPKQAVMTLPNNCGFALCLEGVRSYYFFHVDDGEVLGLCDLVGSLIFMCRDQHELFRKAALDRNRRRRR